MAKKLKKLDPATAPAGEHADPEVRFLKLHVSPVGSRSWRVRLRQPSERAKRVTLGYWPEMSHDAARQAALIARGAIRRKADPKAVMHASKPQTVSAVIDKFLADPMTVRKAHVTEVYRQGLRQSLRAPVRRNSADYFAGIRNKLIADVERRDIEALKDAGTPIEHLRKLAVFFSWAARHEYVKTSPFVHVHLPQSGKDTRALISNSEGGIDWRELAAVMRGVEKFAKEQPDSPWSYVYRLQLFTAIARGREKRERPSSSCIPLTVVS